MTERDELERLREEVARLHAELDAERRHAVQWREVAEQRRVTLERFRQHPAVRLVLWVARWALPPARRAARRATRLRRKAERAGSAARGAPHRLTAPRREAELRRRVAALPPPPRDERSVSVVVLTRDGRDHLEALLPALRERTTHDRLEVVVVDNGSGPETRAFLAAQADVRVVRNETNLSFSEANDRAAAAATGEVLVFLNDDVEPLSHGWLPRMLAALRDDVVAVGAQLVYPRRPLLASARTRDVGVQHRGIAFEPVPGGVPRAVHPGHGDDPDLAGPPVEVAAATAACLAVRRDAFDAVGGFDLRYTYGAEDVDLCWRLRAAGGRVVVVPDAVLLHHEGATRFRETDLDARTARQAENWRRLADRFGPQLARAVALDRLRGDLVLAARPYEVAITITRGLPEAGYGDWYTAHELGDELARLGWRVRYVEKYRDAWYDLPETVDAVVVLLDTFDVARVARPGLTTVAWIRNWTERWIGAPWFDAFDLVLVSSGRQAELVAERSRHRPVVVPLATNPARFAPGDGAGSRVVFAGNYWGRDTRVDELAAAVPELEVYGKGWEEVAAVAGRWRGSVAYDDLADVYRDALVVVDQAASHTRAYGSLNARVFDALAAGALPVTDQVAGARELFGDRLPTWESPEELAAVVRRCLADPAGTRRLAGELREAVLDAHTYAARAGRFRDLLADRARRASFVLDTSAEDRAVAPRWGDWHLAEALARELSARGHPTRVRTADEWDDPAGYAADVAVHLRGRSVAPRREGQVHVVWNISHPEELTPEECDAADLVLVASRTFPDELRPRTTTPVGVLLQATDERRFRPLPPDPGHAHDVAFVGNSRFVERPVVRDAVAAGLRPAVHGANWDRFVDPELVVATHVPNEELPRVYASVRVLLNDHWEGMRRHGFVSNRVLDALACGACVVSDAHDELRAMFGDAVATYDGTPGDLRRVVGELLADDERRARMGAAGREEVLAHHTFAVRAGELLDALRPLLPDGVVA